MPLSLPDWGSYFCCGEPTVQGGAQCTGNQTSCMFTITQSLCVEIPISFGAVVETGTAVVQCGTVSETQCDCSDDVEEEVREQRGDENRERRFF